MSGKQSFNLLAKTFAKILELLETRLMGLKSLIQEALFFWGMRADRVALCLQSKCQCWTNSWSVLMISFFIKLHTILTTPMGNPSTPGAVSSTQYDKASSASPNSKGLVSIRFLSAAILLNLSSLNPCLHLVGSWNCHVKWFIMCSWITSSSFSSLSSINYSSHYSNFWLD